MTQARIPCGCRCGNPLDAQVLLVTSYKMAWEKEIPIKADLINPACFSRYFNNASSGTSFESKTLPYDLAPPALREARELVRAARAASFVTPDD